MIILPCQKSAELQQLETILPRYHGRDSTYHLLKDEHGRKLAGYLGEKSLQYYVNLMLNDQMMGLFGGRFSGQKSHFQIDLLLITAGFLLIVEAKHLKGVLSINGNRQLLQEVDGRTEVYQNPIIQAEIQRHQLEIFLERHKIEHPPIHTCATFTHPDAILNFHEPHRDIFPSQQLLAHYKNLHNHSKQIWNKSEVTKLSCLMRDQHTPLMRDMMSSMDVDYNQIIRGVFCTICEKSIMTYYYTKWICPQCGCVDADAHFRALRDFAMIHQKSLITNKEARDFLNIRSRSTCARLLSALPMVGSRGTASYSLKDLI